MSWSIGYDDRWKRDIGYGVPAWCDHPDCNEVIDRGLAHVCGGEPYGGEKGCGLYFCGKHHDGDHSLCEKCQNLEQSFLPSKEHPDWVRHKLTDESWGEWRKENLEEVKAMETFLARLGR